MHQNKKLHYTAKSYFRVTVGYDWHGLLASQVHKHLQNSKFAACRFKSRTSADSRTRFLRQECHDNDFCETWKSAIFEHWFRMDLCASYASYVWPGFAKSSSAPTIGALVTSCWSCFNLSSSCDICELGAEQNFLLLSFSRAIPKEKKLRPPLSR